MQPLATYAVAVAVGPGSTSTGAPASRHARTRRRPGSDTPGMPASLQYAMTSPASTRATMPSAREPMSASSKTLQALADAERRQQLAGNARILRAHHIGAGQRVKRALRHIAQVADGRRA